MLKFCGRDSDPPSLRFTNTWLSGLLVSPAYLTYRWAVATLCLTGLIQSLVHNANYFLERGQPENVTKYFIYLTNNGRLVAVLATLLEAGLVTGRFVRPPRPTTDYFVGGSELVQLPILVKVLWVLTNISSSLSVMISLVYWLTLHNPDRHLLDFENFSGHLIIALLNIVDVFISNRPWRLEHAAHPVLFSTMFGSFSFLYHLVGGTNYYHELYIYHILDWARPGRTLLVMLGVAFVLVIIHGIFYLLYLAREFCARRLKGDPLGGHSEQKTVSLIGDFDVVE